MLPNRMPEGFTIPTLAKWIDMPQYGTSYIILSIFQHLTYCTGLLTDNPVRMCPAPVEIFLIS